MNNKLKTILFVCLAPLLGCHNFVRTSELKAEQDYVSYVKQQTDENITNAYVCAHYSAVADIMHQACQLQGPEKQPEACLFRDTYTEICMAGEEYSNGDLLLKRPEKNFQVEFNKRLRELKKK